MLESLEICNVEVTEFTFEVTAYHCPNTKELKLLNCQMISDLCNFYHILMENISFDESIFKTVPVSYLTAADKGPYDNQHNIEDFKRVLGEVKQAWSKAFNCGWTSYKQERSSIIKSFRH
ncbi:unnamed protein product [Mucor circinelloides]